MQYNQPSMKGSAYMPAGVKDKYLDLCSLNIVKILHHKLVSCLFKLINLVHDFYRIRTDWLVLHCTLLQL